MYLLYTFLLAAGMALASPYYLIRFRNYAPSLRDRFGRTRTPRLKRSVWVHAVSVGEVRAVERLISRLRPAYPGRPLVVSTATPAGQQLARESGLADHAFYFPFDFPGPVRRTLDRLDPEIVIIAETEIWPNFLRECRKRGIKVMMINGRISDRSLPRYRLIRRWLKHVLADYAVLGMQSETDRRRIEMLGAVSAKVAVFGNLKYDASAAFRPLDPNFADLLARHQPLWIAASTTPGEEEHVLLAYKALQPHHPGLTLLIAPRHPSRFDAVEQLIRQSGLPCLRRSNSQFAIRSPQSPPVLLLDSIGELGAAFRYAAVVFVGGSLVPRGGHNILEPAAFSKPIVFGPHMENFRDISKSFLAARAAVQIRDASGLSAAIDALLSDRTAAAEIGANAREIVERNSGATERVMVFIQTVLDPLPSAARAQTP